MPDRADDKGEKLTGTPQAVWVRQIHCGHGACGEKESSWDPQAVWARRIHADTALATRRRVIGPPQAVWDSCRHGINGELIVGRDISEPSLAV